MEKASQVNWRSKQGEYRIVSLRDPSLEVILPSPYSGLEVHNTDYIGAFLTNELHAEAKVLTLRAQGKPIGYLMRLSAAFSSAVGIDENWFRSAAISAGLWSLQYVSESAIAKSLLAGGSTSIDQLLSDQLSVLFLRRDLASLAGIDSVNQLLPQLFSIGFVAIDDLSRLNPWTPGSDATRRLDTAEKSLNVRPIPIEARRFDFLVKAFSTLLPSATTPLVKFFFNYQLLELLMEEVADASLEEQLQKLVDSRSMRNSTAFKEAMRELQRLSSEITHLERVCNLRGVSIPELSPLSATCEAMLKSIGQLPEGSVAVRIYAIRNQLFHNFRLSGDTLVNQLAELNDAFEVVLPELLLAVLQDHRHVEMSSEDRPIICEVHSSQILP